MASETSGDCVGVCEHPTRTPTTSSASEVKHTGKVLILDLLMHQTVLIECTLYCRTLLPKLTTYPLINNRRTGKFAGGGRWGHAGGNVTARPKPGGRSRLV